MPYGKDMLGGVPCDGSSEWVYNTTHRVLRTDAMRYDRCSALVADICDDLGADLHERHRLPEGYLLAESTPVLASGAGCESRLLWADSETENCSVTGIQTVSSPFQSRHSIFWCENTTDIGERVYLPTEGEQRMLSAEAAAVMMEYARYAHVRIAASAIADHVLMWLERQRRHRLSWSVQTREIFKKASMRMSDRAASCENKEEALEAASEMLKVSLMGDFDMRDSKISEAVSVSDFALKEENLSADWRSPVSETEALASEIFARWGARYGTCKYKETAK